MALVLAIHFAHSPGRDYYERKRAEGKTGREPIRSLKRRISDLIYAHLVADAKAAGTWRSGPGGQPGNVTESSATGSHPEKPALRNSHSRTAAHTTTRQPSRPRKKLPRAS